MNELSASILSGILRYPGVLQDVRPTCFVGVPRVWEKFKEKVEGQLRETTGIKEFVLGKARVRLHHSDVIR